MAVRIRGPEASISLIQRRQVHGVVFDFDGVIAKSMEIHAEAYRQLLAPHGLSVTDRQVFMREGARSETIIAEFLGSRAGEFNIPDLASQKQRIFAAIGAVELYPGAAAMVKQLQGRHPTGLVTGTRRGNLDAIIPDLVAGFDVVMAQESYTHDKPHPEPYQNAARDLSIAPAELIAVENAQRGVASAQAAGYGHVIAITTTLSPDDLRKADSIVRNHSDLAAKLDQLLR